MALHKQPSQRRKTAHHIVFSAIGIFLFGGTGCSDPEPSAVQPPSADVSQARPKRAETPPALNNETTAPGTNFYQHAVGTWAATTQVPYGFNSVGPLTDIRHDASVVVIDTISQTPALDDPEHLRALRTAYSAFFNLRDDQADPFNGLRHHFSIIDSAESKAELFAAMARPDLGLALPFELSVQPDLRTTRSYGLHINQARLGLGAPETYTAPEFAPRRTAYVASIERWFSALGESTGKNRVANLVELEKRLGEKHHSDRRLTRPELNYEKVPPEYLATIAPDIPWKDVLSNAGFGAVTEFILTNPEAIAHANAVMNAVPLSTWKDYAKLRTTRTFALALPRSLRNTIAIDETGSDRRADALATLDQLMRPEMTVAYANAGPSPETINGALSMVNAVTAEATAAASELEWIDERPTATAQDKLSSIRLKLGYPPFVAETATPELHVNDPVGNNSRMLMTYYSRATAKLFGGDAITDWRTPSYFPNLSYAADRNEVVISAAFIHPETYDPDAPFERNLGRLGVMVAHELWHVIDPAGRYSDKDGFFLDWWSDETEARFSHLVATLEGQTSNDPTPSGDTSLETISDIAGLTLAFRVFERWATEQNLSATEKKGAAQRFFLSWAEIMRRVYTDEERLRRMATDTHAIAEIRVNRALQNVDGWYTAFDITASDPMFIPPEQRVKTW